MNADARDFELVDLIDAPPAPEACDEAPRSWWARRYESGLVLVWTSLFLMVLLGFAALAVDLGHAYYVAQKAQNAVDAAALAGAPYLPGDVTGAQDAAQALASANGFTDGDGGVTVTATQSDLDPTQLVVTVQEEVPTWFARVIGFNVMTVAKSATAIADQPTSKPIDLMLIIDRTQSMTATDLANVKDAAKALLGALNPATVNVALGVLGPSTTGTECSANGTSGAFGLPSAPATASPTPAGASWIVSPWPWAPPTNDYQNPDATVNTSSQIVKTIDCLTTSQVNTDLGTPIQAARAYFAAYGRPGAKQTMIFLTDGEANMPKGSQPCKYAFDEAATAKAAGISIVTIGFGVENAFCHDPANPGTSPYDSASVTTLLSAMASPSGGLPSTDDLGCTDLENADGDNFFCEPKSGDLSEVFVTAAGQLTEATPRLIK